MSAKQRHDPQLVEVISALFVPLLPHWHGVRKLWRKIRPLALFGEENSSRGDGSLSNRNTFLRQGACDTHQKAVGNNAEPPPPAL